MIHAAISSGMPNKPKNPATFEAKIANGVPSGITPPFAA